MWDEPDEFGVPSNMFGYVPEDFIRALGRIVMLSALVENLLAHLVARTGRLDSEETMTWAAGRLTAALDRIANVRKLDPRVLEVKAEVRQLLDVRNALVHSMWPFHGGRAPRGWRYPPGRKGDSELDSTEW